jgi:hypothetical protein
MHSVALAVAEGTGHVDAATYEKMVLETGQETLTHLAQCLIPEGKWKAMDKVGISRAARPITPPSHGRTQCACHVPALHALAHPRPRSAHVRTHNHAHAISSLPHARSRSQASRAHNTTRQMHVRMGGGGWPFDSAVMTLEAAPTPYQGSYIYFI